MKQMIRLIVLAIASILLFSSCSDQETVTGDESTSDTQAAIAEETTDTQALKTIQMMTSQLPLNQLRKSL